MQRQNGLLQFVQPGPIDTDMNPDNTDFAKEVKKSVALGRYGKPEEIASVVALEPIIDGTSKATTLKFCISFDSKIFTNRPPVF